MKPNQKNRYNGRYNNRNKRTMILRNTALESSGPSGKLHGTALQLFEKYQSAAKDALIQNDLVLAQTYLQYADHYIRLQNIAIANEQSLAMQSQQNILNNQQRNYVESKAVDSFVSDELPVFDTPAEPCCAAIKEDVSMESDTKSIQSIPEENLIQSKEKAGTRVEKNIHKKQKSTLKAVRAEEDTGEQIEPSEIKKTDSSDSTHVEQTLETSSELKNMNETKAKKNTLVLRRPGRPRVKPVGSNVSETESK